MESRRLDAKATNGSSCATDHCTANLRRNIAPITRIKKAGRLNPRGTTCTVLAPPKAPAQGGTVLGLSVPQSLRTATADAWIAKNDPEENLPQLSLGVESSLKKTEQLLKEPERKSSARNCYCETVARRYETAHVADSQRSLDPLFKNKRSRTIAKGGGPVQSARLLELT
jgi:hypothetical protein